MDYSERLTILEILRKEKFFQYSSAVAKYIQPNQDVITFKEVSDLKAELDEIYVMIRAVENASENKNPS